MNNFAIRSKTIEAAALTASAYGNAVSEVSQGWSEVEQVVYMRAPLNDAARAAILEMASLRHWMSAPTPHNPAEEGFTDEHQKVAIAFPLMS